MADLGRNEKFAIFGRAASQRIDRTKVRLSAEQMRSARQSFELAELLDLAQSMTGPGFPLDRKLREFVREFNNRVMMAHGDEQPQSFDVLQAFVEPHDKSFLLKILPETFHSLDVNFILDRLTEPNAPSSANDLMSLREGIIYHVNIPGSYQNLRFVGNDDLAFYGAAFVRHDDELSIIGVAAKQGRITGLEPVPFGESEFDQNRRFLRLGREVVDHNHAEFYEGEDLYPLVFLTRVDIVRKTIMVRFILEEMKDAFSIYSDSRQMYTYLSKERNLSVEKVSGIFDQSQKEIEKYAQVFSLIRDIPLAVLDLDNDDDLSISRYPTALYLSKTDTKVRKIRSTLSSSEAPNYVNVKSVIKAASGTKSYDWRAETFKVEQGGYWKTLAPGKIGVGKNGDAVYGRTWVDVKESWVESLGFAPPEASNSLHVEVETDSDDSGFVYVMRSASHPRDQYKIGFTLKDPYDRASQLYSTSGQSDQFNVVQQWKVKGPRRVEALVHNRLASYRVNPKREFFSLKYEKIRETIERSIQDLEAEMASSA